MRLSMPRSFVLAGLTLFAADALGLVQAPPAPTNVSATAVSASQINVAWVYRTYSGCGFYLYRSSGGASYIQVAFIQDAFATRFPPPPGPRSYGDSGLSAGATYYYKMKATCGGPFSADSNIASTTTFPAAPSAPTGLTATSAGAQINLSWTDTSGNETGFKVERKTSAAAAYSQVATVSANATSFGDTNVVPLTTYYYRVSATNSVGDSAYSNEASAALPAQIYYIHPDHLNTPRVIANQAGTIVWRWDQGEPFGNDPPNDNPFGVVAFEFNLRFPGQYFDRETGLAYNYFRDYDPKLGRYVQSDPLGLAGGINTYTYVINNPVSLIDPEGLFGTTLGGLQRGVTLNEAIEMGAPRGGSGRDCCGSNRGRGNGYWSGWRWCWGNGNRTGAPLQPNPTANQCPTICRP